MVRRPASLSRRVLAYKGSILGFVVWCGAALTCAVLYPLRATPSGGLAMAVIDESMVRAPEGGHLVTVGVRPGEAVRAGDVVATIEVPGLAQQIVGAEAKVESLRTRLDSASADRARKFAKDVDSNRSDWLAAQVKLETTKANLSRTRLELARLQAPGVEAARGQIDTLQAEEASFVNAIAAQTSQIEALRRATSAAEVRAGAGAASTDPLLAEAQAALDTLLARQEALTLRAAVSGVVDAHVLPVGEWVNGGDVVTIVRQGETDRAIVYVATSTAQSLDTTRPVLLHGPHGEELAAQIQSVGAAVEQVPPEQLHDPMMKLYGVPVLLGVTGRTLTPGETLSVEF